MTAVMAGIVNGGDYDNYHCDYGDYDDKYN